MSPQQEQILFNGERANAADGVDPSAALAEERTLCCDLKVNDESLQRMAEMNVGERDISAR